MDWFNHIVYAAKHNADQKPSFHALLSAVELHPLANASSQQLQQIAEKDAHLLYQTEAGNNLCSVAQ